MEDQPTPDHLLTRIFQVAQLLVYAGSLQDSAQSLQQSTRPNAPSIIVGKDHPAGNSEKKPLDQEKL